MNHRLPSHATWSTTPVWAERPSAETRSIRTLGTRDLQAYKSLRDTMIVAAPDAFHAEPSAEIPKPAEVYLHRFGIGLDDPGTFTLGGFVGAELVGAVSCERDPQPKVQHIGHIVGMMVRPDWQGLGMASALLQHLVAHVECHTGLRQLILSVTASNRRAVGVYERARFVRYGTLPDALRTDGAFVDKALMLLKLRGD